jgi:hypothetical protein
VGYAAKWLYHPEHLNYPLKRAGARGEGKWQRISWDQALDEIAEKLKSIKAQYGAESLVFAEGTYRGSPFWMRSRFASLFGNPQNITHKLHAELQLISHGSYRWHLCGASTVAYKLSGAVGAEPCRFILQDDEINKDTL